MSSINKGSSRTIPHDLVEDILTRLPVKHVVRCKLLSKTYNALINNPRFINKHLLYHQSFSTKSNVVTMNTGPEVDSIVSLLPSQSDISFVSPLSRYNRISMIGGSCNGLVCALQWNPLRNPPMLWNPATREHKMLPPFKYEYPRAVGFGYDARSDDYKLVVISYYDDLRVELWGMRTNCWREIGTQGLPLNLIKEYAITERSGLLMRGKLYWFAHPSILSRLDNHPHRVAIISFDLCDDSLRMQILDETMFKECLPIIGPGSSVFDFRGSLALSVPWYNVWDYDKQTDMDEWTFHVWVMVGDDDFNLEDISSWTKKISLGPFMFHVYVDYKMTRVDDTKLLLKDMHSHKAILCDLHTNDQRELSYDSTSRHGQPWCYTESLVSVTCRPSGSGGGVEHKY